MVNKSHEEVKKQNPGALKGAATVEKDNKGKIGHNSGTIKKLVADFEKLEKDKKDIGKAQREIKAQLKEQGVPSVALSQVLRERKMAPDVRANFYQDTHIIRDSLGMQTSLFDKAQFEEGQRGPTEEQLDKVKKLNRAPLAGEAKPDPVAAAASLKKSH